MGRFRFHLGTLVIPVLLMGVGFAALRESNEIWDSGLFSITLGLLLISILLAVHRLGSRRAFWLGFAIFGWIYLGLSSVPSIESRLVTTKALHYLDSRVPRSSPLGLTYVDYGNLGSMDRYVVNNTQTIALVPHTENDTPNVLTAVAGSNSVGSQTWFSNLPGLAGSNATTEHFVRIGHSLLALLVGGQLSRRLSRSSSEPDASTVVNAELPKS